MEKILVVDDEPGILELLTEVLAGDGYAVEGFTDPRKALKALEDDHFDIIITDLKMPDIDGIQLTHSAKAINQEIQVIVITGYASLESTLNAFKQDVYEYILKPFNASDILMTVRKAA